MRRAADSADILLPIYSQYQTAMPGSAGHYLVAQCEILLGTLDALSSLRDGLTVSPLGASRGDVRHRPAMHGDPAGFLGRPAHR